MSVAVLFSLVVHSLLSYDLHRHVPVARAILSEDEKVRARRFGGRRPRVVIVQTAFIIPRQQGRDEDSDSDEREFGSWFDRDEKGRRLMTTTRSISV